MSATLTPSAELNYIASVVLIVFASLSVLIRFSLRLFKRQVPNGPDWLCLASTVIFDVHCGLIIHYIFYISEYHAFDLDYSFSDTDILWFYYSLFSIDLVLKRVIQATAAVCVAWLIVFELVLVFQCKPVQAFWEHFDEPEYCLEFPRVFLGYEITNLFIDVAILCIPTSAVSQLQLPRPKKLSVIGIFLLGSVVCIASILRLDSIWKPPDVLKNFNLGLVYFWSDLQLGLAILTSCLPTFGPLLPFLRRPVASVRDWYGSPNTQSSLLRPRRRYKVPDVTGAESPWVTVGDGRFDSTMRSWAYGEDDNDLQLVSHPVPPRQILVSSRTAR
ncbi:hypothetical protein CHU98_g4561 [Xylaria longipes]|nr:hypothetical protein CHU98_g4561 [Xylaria longipes]